MVTTKEIESLGWEHYATSSNGGSKSFKKGLFTIYSNAENFITHDRDTIIISKYYRDSGGPNIRQLFNGGIETIQELISKLIEVGADIELCRDHKINMILNQASE